MKLNKRDFGILKAEFSQFSCENVKTCLLDGRLGTGHQIRALQRFLETIVFQHLVRKLLH